MQITKRDIEILEFINDFGFCEIIHIQKKFKLKKPRSYKVMQKLIQADLIIHERVFHNRNGIYYLSKKGAKLTHLPSMSTIPINNYQHQVTIIEIYLKLIEQYPDAIWISERQLKRDKFMTGIGKTGHVADGMIILPDQKQIAIEVEIAVKGERRLEKILRSYAAQFSIQEVWYFCSAQAIKKITQLAAALRYIKVYSSQQFLEGSNKN